MVTQCQLLVHTVSNNVTHKVQQVISLFIATLIWGQMSFQHWLHLCSFGAYGLLMYCFSLSICYTYLQYLLMCQSKHILDMLGLAEKCTYECIWLYLYLPFMPEWFCFYLYFEWWCKPFQQEEIPCKSEDINLLTVSVWEHSDF